MDVFSAEDSSSSFPSSPSAPRISFSHNLDNSIIDSYPYRSESSSDFNFCFSGDPIETHPSSASDLFSDGLIRPNYNPNTFSDGPFCNGLVCDDYKEQETETPVVSNSFLLGSQERSKEIVPIEGNQSKSFWRIKRSSSLHSESTKLKSSSFWSSLPLLSRSNSTGSVAMKERYNKQNSSQKERNKNSSMAVYSSMKPPLKRSYGGGGGYDYGVIRISPVLNVSPPFISKNAANMLGLGSFFRHGSDHKNKK